MCMLHIHTHTICTCYIQTLAPTLTPNPGSRTLGQKAPMAPSSAAVLADEGRHRVKRRPIDGRILQSQEAAGLAPAALASSQEAPATSQAQPPAPPLSIPPCPHCSRSFPSDASRTRHLRHCGGHVELVETGICGIEGCPMPECHTGLCQPAASLGKRISQPPRRAGDDNSEDEVHCSGRGPAAQLAQATMVCT